jgi:hypothetical protein
VFLDNIVVRDQVYWGLKIEWYLVTRDKKDKRLVFGIRNFRTNNCGTPLAG